MSKFEVLYEVVDGEKSAIVGTPITKRFANKQDAERFVNYRQHELAAAALAGKLKVELHEVPRTFADFLEDEKHDGKIDFCIRVNFAQDGIATGYIYPLGKSGNTLDLCISGNEVKITYDTEKTGEGPKACARAEAARTSDVVTKGDK